MEVTAKDKKEDLDRMIKRMKKLDSHSSLYLLINSLWLPKLQYLLRAAPFFQHTALLKDLDDLVRTAIEDLINVRFSDANWEQAVLPTRLGGLGLRRVTDVSLPSFIASVHRCRQLVSTILPNNFCEAMSDERKKAEDEWLSRAGDKLAPVDEACKQQKSWDAPIAEHLMDQLLLEANQVDRARILGAATSESSAWLRALPSASLGTHLDNETVRVAVALRVGADVYSGFHSCKCGTLADTKGHHVLTCRFSAGRIPRHTALNDIVRRALLAAGVPALLEPRGIDRGDGKRPDGMTIYPFSHGRCLVWDATCVNTFAISRLGDASLKPGAAAMKAEKEKCRKYAQLTERFRFEPLAFETDGACGPTTRSFVRELGARMSAVSGDPRETEWLLQRFSIAVVRGNAASILIDSHTEPSVTKQGQHSNHEPRLEPTDASASGSPNGHHFISEARNKCTVPLACTPLPPVQCNASETRSVTSTGNSGNLVQEDARQVEEKQHQTLATSQSSQGRTLVASTRPLVLSTRSLPAGTIGLENLGNSCYMNAVLQVLAQTQDLVNYMMSERSTQEVSVNTRLEARGPVAEELTQLLRIIWSRRPHNVAPNRFRAAISARHKDFGDMQMHDAHEFLILLLEWLHTDLKPAVAPAAPLPVSSADIANVENGGQIWRQLQQTHGSIVTQLFYGLQKSTLQCTACGFESATFEPFSLLSLPLRSPTVGRASLQHCLDQYLHRDLIADWSCPKCKNRHDAYKKLDLWGLPPVLIFHLKRFSFADNTASKADAHVSFPMRDLDMSQLSTGPRSSTHSMVYDLYGVVEHHGSQNNGHYTAYCFNQPVNSWFSMNDAITKKSDITRVQHATAYLLCYSAKKSAPPCTPALPLPSPGTELAEPVPSPQLMAGGTNTDLSANGSDEQVPLTGSWTVQQVRDQCPG